jgi:hypothetical protein
MTTRLFGLSLSRALAAINSKTFPTKLPLKSALNVALCFKPLVGGASGRTWVGAEQCRPEAWAVRGKASMPEAPS